MNQKSFNWAAGIIFSIAGAFHLIRSILEWPVLIGNWLAPLGLSVIIFLIAAVMTFSAFSLSVKNKDKKEDSQAGV